MRIALLALSLWAGSAAAQDAAPPYRAIDDLQRLFIEDTVGMVAAPPAAAAEARVLMDQAGEARARGDNATMRRLLSQARAAIGGVAWTPASLYAASLSLRVSPAVADPAQLATLWIGQHFAAPRCAACSVSVELRQTDGTVVRGFGAPAIPGDDLIDRLVGMTLDLSGIADGAYDVTVVTRRGSAVLTESATRMWVVENAARDLADIRLRAAKLNPKSPLAATILYPTELAASLDRGARQVANVRFRALIDRSLALLDAGSDPLARERGLSARAYRSAVTGRVEPYQLYIPKSWDGHSSLPLVVLLHGSNGDEGSVLVDGKAAGLAEAHGWALLSPFGYSPNGGWGNHLPVVLANGTSPAPRPSTIDGVVLPKDGVTPEPAERDVIDALAEVRKAYPVDARRIYLAGNSMGGEGVWHLAQLYPDLWAAASPGAGGLRGAYPYDRVRRLPILAVHGTKDPIISFAASKAMVDRLKAEGAPAELLAIEGAGHRAMNDVLPQVFDFFARHVRR